MSNHQDPSQNIHQQQDENEAVNPPTEPDTTAITPADEEAHRKRIQEAQELLKAINAMSQKQNVWKEHFEQFCRVEADQEARTLELSKSVLLGEAESLASGSFVTWMLSREKGGVNSSETLSKTWFHMDEVALLTPFQAMVPYPSQLTPEGLEMVQQTINDLFFSPSEEGRDKKKRGVQVRSLSGSMPQWFLGKSLLRLKPNVVVKGSASKSAAAITTAADTSSSDVSLYALVECFSGAEVTALTTASNSNVQPSSEEKEGEEDKIVPVVEGGSIMELRTVLGRTPCLFLDASPSPQASCIAKAAVVQGSVIAAQLSQSSTTTAESLASSVVESLARFIEENLCSRIAHRTFLVTAAYYQQEKPQSDENDNVLGRWALIALDPLSGDELELFTQQELLMIASYLAKYKNLKQEGNAAAEGLQRVVVSRWYDVESRGAAAAGDATSNAAETNNTPVPHELTVGWRQQVVAPPPNAEIPPTTTVVETSEPQSPSSTKGHEVRQEGFSAGMVFAVAVASAGIAAAAAVAVLGKRR